MDHPPFDRQIFKIDFFINLLGQFKGLLSGAERPDAGHILWRGQEAFLRTPRYARQLGIGMAFQHFALIDDLSVRENLELYLGRARLKRILTHEEELLPDALALPIDLDRTVETLSAGEKQRLEITRVLFEQPDLLRTERNVIDFFER